MRLLPIATLLFAASCVARAGDSAIVGTWVTYGRAFEGMAPISVTETYISIETCTNARYSVVSEETTSKHWLWSGQVRSLTVKLTGPGCDDPKNSYEFLRFDIPLENDPENQLLVNFCSEKRSEGLWFGCSGIFHRVAKK